MPGCFTECFKPGRKTSVIAKKELSLADRYTLPILQNLISIKVQPWLTVIATQRILSLSISFEQMFALIYEVIFNIQLLRYFVVIQQIKILENIQSMLVLTMSSVS